MKKYIVLMSVAVLFSLKADNDTVGQKKQNQSIHIKDIAEQSALNIRFVDCFQAMQSCQAGVEAQKELKNKQDAIMQDLQVDGQKFNQAKQKLEQAATEYNSKKTTLSEAAREKEEKNLRKMDTDLRKMESDYKNKAQESEYELKLAQQKIVEKLAKETEEAIVAVAKRDKFDAVVDVSTGRVFYANPTMTVTQDVVKEMDVQRTQKLAHVNETKKNETTIARVDKKQPMPKT